jgi:hypothetical protein
VKQRYNKQFTQNGSSDVVSAPGDEVFSKFAVQVKGVGGVATAWTVVVEGSIDGVNFTTIATHNTASGDGVLIQVVDKPCTHWRATLSGLTLAPATALNVNVVGAP